ncbi:MAG: prolyl oligopeptidase family serine peptidase [Bryobacteraceae bacterium]
MKFSHLLLCVAVLTASDEVYRKPPKDVLDVLNAPATPRANVSPAHTYVLLAEPLRYPPIANLSQPMLRLAGLRINPATNGPHRGFWNTSMVLKRISDGAENKLQTPAGAKLSQAKWSADGQHFAFTSTATSGIELWIGETATGRVHSVSGLRVNAVGAPTSPLVQTDHVFQWMPDNRTLLVQSVPANRGPAPTEASVPAGPHIQESSGRTGPVRTYEDMLSNAHDEDLFDYYATAQPVWVDSTTGRVQPFGSPAVFQSLVPSPDGGEVLVARVRRPYSYLHPMYAFPKEVEIWDHSGKPVYKVASLGLEDRVPIDGVPTGPRNYAWRPTGAATLVWVEAMDGGNPKEKATHRDRIVMLKSPFRGEPTEVFETEQRFRGLEFSEKGSAALIEDYDRNRRWIRTFLVNPDQPAKPAKVLWSLNVQDRYHNPGTPVTIRLANGERAIHQNGNAIFLSGAGAGPQGDRPFFDRFDLETGKTDRLFRSQPGAYETFVGMLDDTGSKILTERESPTDPPNYFVRTIGSAGDEKALTHFPDPTPQLRGITKQLVTYKREDGVPLSFTLYLPPAYKTGTRLPTVVWAYPLEFNDADTAGQVTGSTDRFTTIVGPSHLFFLLHGYAILDNAAMPVVGNPETVNNTYLEQIVMDAKAAIDKAVEMGVTDRNRVGVGGHSYGAFMTANLLAHSNLFRAGIARSGAYNRTLTPFGFQTERRTFWEAPDVYTRMSPFWNADKIKAPLLMIHGEADDNTGTFPIQSERMYQAVRGNGGTVRLVTLPAEAHGYAGKESIEHTLYEMLTWFDKWVKNANAG